MSRITLVLAALFAVMLSAPLYAAPVGNPFLRGVHSPKELAEKIGIALWRDPSGQSVIDPERCKRDGSCAKPADFLEMFQKSDPGAHLVNVRELSAFLQTLGIADAPEGEYWLACLKPFRPVLHCLSRQFKPGEKGWADPGTGQIILASDCTNPVEKEVPKKKCVEVHFFTKAPDTVVRFALLGPTDVSDECIGVKRVGETEFEPWWSDECADENCNFLAASEVVGQPIQLAGSYVPQPGEHVLRLPVMVTETGSLYRVVLCLDRNGKHSDGIGVQWFDYRMLEPAGVKAAFVWYANTEVPSWAPRLYWPWGEWDNKNDEK